MSEVDVEPAGQVRERLLRAALDCFLEDDYHAVSTRQIAAKAEANVSMIRYYFGNKEGLFEEMIRETYAPILEVLDKAELDQSGDLHSILKIYYDTMTRTPEFPRLILKILALNQGPGKRFVQQLLERGRVQGARKVEMLKKAGLIDPSLDADVLRMSFVSLAMMPLLLKEVFEQQLGRKLDGNFLSALASFNARLMVAGLKAAPRSGD